MRTTRDVDPIPRDVAERWERERLRALANEGEGMSEVTLPELPPLPYLPESQELRRAMIGWAQDYARKAVLEERERAAVAAWSEGMRLYTEMSGMPLDARRVGAACAAAIRGKA